MLNFAAQRPGIPCTPCWARHQALIAPGGPARAVMAEVQAAQPGPESQEGALDQLAAAMATQGGPAGTQPPPAAPVSPPPPPLAPPAAAFAALCRQLSEAPHPELLSALATVDAGAWAEPTPSRHPGRGALLLREMVDGGVAAPSCRCAINPPFKCHPPLPGGAALKLPVDASPAHVEALLALLCCRLPFGLPDSQQDDGGLPPPPPDRYLRTVHLDLSGHAVGAPQLRDLLLAAPHRLGQCWALESLDLRGCGLGAGACVRCVEEECLLASGQASTGACRHAPTLDAASAPHASVPLILPRAQTSWTCC